MARADKETWMADSAEQVLWSRNGTLLTGHPGGMAMEGAVSWRAETADWNQKDAGKRTCTRLMSRAYLAEGSEMTAQLQYDSTSNGTRQARVRARQGNHRSSPVSPPVRPLPPGPFGGGRSGDIQHCPDYLPG